MRAFNISTMNEDKERGVLLLMHLLIPLYISLASTGPEELNEHSDTYLLIQARTYTISNIQTASNISHYLTPFYTKTQLRIRTMLKYPI